MRYELRTRSREVSLRSVLLLLTAAALTWLALAANNGAPYLN